MDIAIKTLMLEVVKETLALAERQVSKQRPISNIDAQAICNRFITGKEDALTQNSNTNLYWLTAVIESPYPAQDTCEPYEIVGLIQEGFTSGHNANETGSYRFDLSRYS